MEVFLSLTQLFSAPFGGGITSPFSLRGSEESRLRPPLPDVKSAFRPDSCLSFRVYLFGKL